MDNNFNIDQDTINKLNDMMKNKDISKMVENFSKSMAKNIDNTNNSNNENNVNFSNFDFNNIDPSTIIKVKNIMNKMNNSNDPRSNLLASLKPYLRDSKKEKLDQYANIVNFAKIADIFKSDLNNNQ